MLTQFNYVEPYCIRCAAAHRDLDFIEEADLVLASGKDIVSTLSFLELNKRTRTDTQTLKELSFVCTVTYSELKNILQAVGTIIASQYGYVRIIGT